MILYLICGFGMVICNVSQLSMVTAHLLPVYRTSTSCLPCDIEFFMIAIMKIFATDISTSTGRNDFIFDMWLWYGDL
jgi:hypothetical protein